MNAFLLSWISVSLCSAHVPGPVNGVPDYARILGISLGPAGTRDLEHAIGPRNSFEASGISYWKQNYRDMDPGRVNAELSTDGVKEKSAIAYGNGAKSQKKRDLLIDSLMIKNWKGRLADCNPFHRFPPGKLGRLAFDMSNAEVRSILSSLNLQLVTKDTGGGQVTTFLSSSEVRVVRIGGRKTACTYSLRLGMYNNHLSWVMIFVTRK